jgi:chemotaxis protein MotB
MLRGRFEEDQENLDRWLLTYADLITLLLALFVVMYSMSRVDAEKFDNISDALNEALKGSSGLLKGEFGDGFRGGGPLKLKDLRIIRKELWGLIENKDLDSEIEVITNSRGLIIHITESSFFETGKADIKPGARDILNILSTILVGIPNEIRIEGHTDDIPINTPEFPSNWELSTARATNVLRYLVEECGLSPDRISALGFGEYRPLVPNTGPENRRKNRRTDIVVLVAEAGRFEPSRFSE